jgi:DNA-directed RNA polymerase subunit RPC12/RpoP
VIYNQTLFCSLTTLCMLGEWKCNNCHRLYSSKTTLSSHRCSTKPSPIYQCHVCKREFLRRSYLHKHMLLHLENHPCTTCGKKLQSGEALQNHQLYCTRVSNKYLSVVLVLITLSFWMSACKLTSSVHSVP